MSSYLIVNASITDQGKLDEYRNAVGPTLAGRDVKVLVSTNEATTLEGEPAGARAIVIEFPDRAALLDWYHSDEYQAVIGLRFAATAGFAIIADGR
jgi:uncharacterized protein (DUF1330 family)